MVVVRHLEKTDLDELFAVSVTEEQLKFVGTTQEIVEAAPDTSHLHVIVDGDKIVGMFNLDTAYPNTYDFAKTGELGFRAFLIGHEYQGRGLAKKAMEALRKHLEAHYAKHGSIVLTVNCKNPVAYRLYLATGFEDTGELYHGGAAGPQHILRMVYAKNSD
ncbi:MULTISPECIES: GNAT family N-acetyltransferase [Pseudovibrio]|uniref:GNAT family N-acetyltransferase n=1 Tax=Stappiaceae TaxID=2821832 RepID=UPI002365C4C5|nr:MULTISPECIES: GNAT family N-acetyltransferase [Pseudovibrio]MDD7908845.1 GNAT family N-acetyltransferase [Pseudovibrio exalbescens]MDX5593838.1 GNAT family N-acetyltransferase [Pseudovibrio sp. SPO723]